MSSTDFNYKIVMPVFIYRDNSSSGDLTSSNVNSGSNNTPGIILGVASVVVAILALFNTWKCWESKKPKLAVGVFILHA